MRGLRIILSVAIVLVALLWYTRLGDEPKRLLSPSRWAKTAEKAITPEPGRLPREAESKWLNAFSAFLDAHRAALAFCVRQNAKGSTPRQFRIDVAWDGAGALQSVRLKPELNSNVEACVSEVVEDFSVARALGGVDLGLRPLSFSRAVELH